MDRDSSTHPSSAIAIVGIGARFPGARNLGEFWENLRTGVESIQRLKEQELLDAGADPNAVRDPNYVKAASVLEGIELFDAPFFGFSPKDAAIMDPQHRVFLECAWEALENAGWCADEFPGSIGVFAGSGMNAYLMFNLVPNQQLMSSTGLFLLKQTGNDKDVLATRVSYQLNLIGPSMSIQTACSTSLVAVHTACQSLLNRECDMALAGGVTIEIPHRQGYLYREGEILSRDGHCRAFDAESSGTVFGSGAGVVVLRRLADAVADGDRIHAVIRGSAINNDGARKVGYLAPSVTGQAEVVAEALAVADVGAESISYVEAHGTGTPVGDPIEIAALTQAFRESTQARGFCGIGSLKTNIGHLDAAAGVAGLIKTVLALQHKELPPSLHFTKPNPRIDFASSPFYVNGRAAEWKSGLAPRRAGVTALGIGGTNAHVILEEAPALAQPGESRPWQVLTLSSKTETALETATHNLADHLEKHPELNLADTAFTGHRGRKALAHRRAIVCDTREEAIRSLRGANPKEVFSGREAARTGIAFLFPGQGAQYVRMARGIYHSEEIFRTEVDRCAELLRPHLGLDPRILLFPPDGADLVRANAQLTETRIAQPVLFAIEYALAKLWMSWGIKPMAMIGHSLGEFVAACLSDVLPLEDALAAVAERGRLMQSVPAGAMLAIPVSEQEARSLAPGALSLASVNGPSQCVLSGPVADIEALEKKLAAGGMLSRRLQTSHAFHSASMDAILGEFTEVMRGCKLQPPRIPYISNVTGAWIKPEEATDPAYWARHLRHTVRFADGLAVLLQEAPAVMLEAGPGRVLSGLAARHPAKTESVKIVSTLRGPEEAIDDHRFLLSALAQVWVAGARVDWAAFHAGERRQRVELPTYPFERQRYWIEAPKAQKAAPAGEPEELSYYRPAWKPADAPPADTERDTWLIFLDAMGLGAKIVKELARTGHTVISVRPGERFAKTGRFGYALQPASGGDYKQLLEALVRAGNMPRRILHLWSLAAPDSPPSNSAMVELTETLSFHSLLFLAQAIGAQDLSEPITLAVVSNDLQSVAGEPVHHPERAVVMGPCKVIPKEFENIRSRSIDVAVPKAGDLTRVVGQILAEAGQAFSQPSELVAYRGEERWVQEIEPARVDSTASHLRDQGVYLITGGTGGIGMVIAEHMARTARAKLVLVSRTGQPKSAAAIQSLENLGAQVEIVRADVTDAAAMKRVIADALRKFGVINGVIHAAGVLDDGLIQFKQKEAAARVLAPKVAGTLALEAALEGVTLDFFALFSSVSCFTAPVGQVDYVAANAFLDAFAASRHAQGKPRTVAINWGRWGETGMAAPPVRPSASSGRHPLLGVASTNTPGALIYQSELSFNGHWLLNEHCVRGGDALFPGTGYIELAYAALQERFAAPAVRLEHLSFSLPLRVARGETRAVEFRASRDGDAYHFTVMPWGSPASPCATGSLRPLSSAAARTIDLPALLLRCHLRELNFGPETQNAKQARHIEFGPRWRCLKRMHFGANEAVSFLELAGEYAADLETYHIHPALLDAATGSAMLTIPGYEQTEDFYVPVSYQGITVLGRLPGRCYCHIRWGQGASVKKETAAFDITIADEQGRVIAEIEQFTLRRLPSAALLSNDPAGRTHPSQENTIPSAAGAKAFASILDSQSITQILAVPSGLRLDQPAPSDSTASRQPSGPLPSNGAPRDAVEQVLAQWWQELLGIDHVSIHDDFFALGGHSLVAVRLLTKIDKEFQKSIPLSVFFEDNTIEALAAIIRGGKPEPATAIVSLSQRGKGQAIFCLHTIGGDVVNFRHLARELGSGYRFYGIQTHPDILAPEFAASLETIAAYYVGELTAFQREGPYILAGASLGSTVALEMARQLRSVGNKVDLLISIDGAPINTGAETSRWSPMYYYKLIRNLPLWIVDDLLDDFSLEVFLHRVWNGLRSWGKGAWDAMRGMPNRRVHELEGFTALRFSSAERDQFRNALSVALKKYVPKPYDGRVLVYQSRTGPLTHLSEVDRAWRSVAENVEVVRVPGNHANLVREPHVQMMAASLKQRLASLRMTAVPSPAMSVPASSGEAGAE